MQHMQALHHPQAQRPQEDIHLTKCQHLGQGREQARTCGGSCGGHREGHGAVWIPHMGSLRSLSMRGEGGRGLPVRHRGLPGGLPGWLPGWLSLGYAFERAPAASSVRVGGRDVPGAHAACEACCARCLVGSAASERSPSRHYGCQSLLFSSALCAIGKWGLLLQQVSRRTL